MSREAVNEMGVRTQIMAHRFEKCEGHGHRHCCVVHGQEVDDVHFQIGGSYAKSEAAARAHVRKVAELDIRPIETKEYRIVEHFRAFDASNNER